LLVNAAPVYVDQILRNLVSNAEKYSPPSAPISIAASTNGDEARVCVGDRGHGVPKDELELLFAPFYRSEATSRGVSAAGIGLSVCKRLVEAQHGRLTAARREGGGMEFCFTLPIVRGEAEE
jgi:two-component system sensor histidine kinase KdpD